jgi:hypothetical protein
MTTKIVRDKINLAKSEREQTCHDLAVAQIAIFAMMTGFLIFQIAIRTITEILVRVAAKIGNRADRAGIEGVGAVGAVVVVVADLSHIVPGRPPVFNQTGQIALTILMRWGSPKKSFTASTPTVSDTPQTFNRLQSAQSNKAAP